MIEKLSTKPRGGARPGSGRKKGAPNRRTVENQALTEATGVTPLEYMLQVMRDPLEDPKARLGAAQAAAPYVHAKLSSVELGGKDGGPLQLAINVNFD